MFRMWLCPWEGDNAAGSRAVHGMAPCPHLFQVVIGGQVARVQVFHQRPIGFQEGVAPLQVRRPPAIVAAAAVGASAARGAQQTVGAQQLADLIDWCWVEFGSCDVLGTRALLCHERRQRQRQPGRSQGQDSDCCRRICRPVRTAFMTKTPVRQPSYLLWLPATRQLSSHRHQIIALGALPPVGSPELRQPRHQPVRQLPEAQSNAAQLAGHLRRPQAGRCQRCSGQGGGHDCVGWRAVSKAAALAHGAWPVQRPARARQRPSLWRSKLCLSKNELPTGR